MKVKFLEPTKYSPNGLDVINAKVGDYGELKDEMAKKFCARKWCEIVGKEPEAKEEIDREVRCQLLEALQETVTKNLKLVNQIEEQLTGDVVIFYNVDLTLLESLSSATV